MKPSIVFKLSFAAMFFALIVMGFWSNSAQAYTLSQKECGQGAEISARAAELRDSGTAKELLISQTEAHKGQYPNETLYELVLEIIRIVYEAPEMTPEQHGQRFLDECFGTKGQMYKKV